MTSHRPAAGPGLRTGGRRSVQDRRLSMWVDAGHAARTLLRDRAALFLVLGFPVVHLVLFGLVLGEGVGEGPTVTTLGVVGSEAVLSGEDGNAVQRVRFATQDHAVRAVESGVVPAAVVQDGDRVTIFHAAGDAGAVATARSVALTAERATATEHRRRDTERVRVRAIVANRQNPVQPVATGVVAWGAATSAALAATLTSVRLRARTRRPASPAEWAVAAGALSLVVAAVQIALLGGATSLLTLDVEASWGWRSLLPVLWSGSLCFVAVGALVGAVARSAESAAAIANMVVLPMALLSGLHLGVPGPRGSMTALSQALPTGWMVNGVTDALSGAAYSATGWLAGVGLVMLAGLVAVRSRHRERRPSRSRPAI